MLKELQANQALIDKGNDSNSSGSEGSPSEDNLDKDVLRHILPSSKHKVPCSKNAKERLRAIFGFVRKKPANPADAKAKEKPKEEKKKEPPKPEKKAEKPAKKPPTEEQKDKPVVPVVTAVDAWTQTEKIDFQKARWDWRANVVGPSG